MVTRLDAMLDDVERDLLQDARGDERLVVLAVLDELRRRLREPAGVEIDLRS